MRLATTGGTSKRGRGRTVKRDLESKLMQFSDRALTESIAETQNFCIKAAVKKSTVGI